MNIIFWFSFIILFVVAAGIWIKIGDSKNTIRLMEIIERFASLQHDMIITMGELEKRVSTLESKQEKTL